MIRNVVEGSFRSFDGTELFYRTWEPLISGVQTEKKALIVFHRGHEHTGRLNDLVNGLGLDDFYAFGFDARGHGKSPGLRGHAPDFSYHMKDLDTFVRMMSEKHGIPIENMAIVANSVGAVISSAWVHDYAPRIRCMVLAAPAFKVKLYVPLALPGLRLLNKIKSPAFISSYVKAKFLTHDPEQARLYEEDPLITPSIAVNILLDLFDTSQRIVKDAQAITTPTLVLSAGSDWVVHVGPQREFFKNLSSQKKEMIVYPGFYHGVLYEKDRHLPLTKTNQFISQCFTEKMQETSLLMAHKVGPTKLEYDHLKFGQRSPLAKISYALQKVLMKSLGKLSEGIRLGFQYGFDSGISLDHVYKNRASGFGPIGKMIDYFYINSLGWKGIRQRKINIQETLDCAISDLVQSGKKVKIMDIGAGPGRYLIEAVQKSVAASLPVEALIRDYSGAAIEEGKEIARTMGTNTADRIRFQIADAFDPATFNSANYSPNILIISGLYELFPDNDQVMRSLIAAGDTVENGGYLMYTGQPWHPQLEMIAETLPNRNGEPWVMRRRTQAELDEMVRTAGFKKIGMKIDRWGIFTVSIAQKMGKLKLNIEKSAQRTSSEVPTIEPSL